MERLLNKVTNFPFVMGTYSGQVYMERLLNDVTYYYSKWEHALLMYI